jgi:hypothetical protein
MLLKIGAGELGGMKSGSERGGMVGLGTRQMSVSLVRLEESDRLDTVELGAAVEEGDLKNEEITDQITTQLLDEGAGSSSGAAYMQHLASCTTNDKIDHGFIFPQNSSINKNIPACCGKTGRGEMAGLGDWRILGQWFVRRSRLGMYSLTSSNNVVDHKHFLAGFHRTLLHLEKVGSVLLFVGGCHARAGHLALLANRHKAGIETQSERGPKQETPRIQPHYNIGLRVLGELEDLEFEGAQQRKMDDRVLEQGENVDKVDAGDWEVREALQGAE